MKESQQPVRRLVHRVLPRCPMETRKHLRHSSQEEGRTQGQDTRLKAGQGMVGLEQKIMNIIATVRAISKKKQHTRQAIDQRSILHEENITRPEPQKGREECCGVSGAGPRMEDWGDGVRVRTSQRGRRGQKPEADLHIREPNTKLRYRASNKG